MASNFRTNLFYADRSSPATLSAPNLTLFQGQPVAVLVDDLAPEEDETACVFIDKCAPLLAATGSGELYSARVSITPIGGGVVKATA